MVLQRHYGQIWHPWVLWRLIAPNLKGLEVLKPSALDRELNFKKNWQKFFSLASPPNPPLGEINWAELS